MPSKSPAGIPTIHERNFVLFIKFLRENYLYLSHKIEQEKDSERRQELLSAVQNGSVSSWGHVNLHAEYDFADEKMQDSVGLQLPPALALDLP